MEPCINPIVFNFQINFRSNLQSTKYFELYFVKKFHKPALHSSNLRSNSLLIFTNSVNFEFLLNTQKLISIHPHRNRNPNNILQLISTFSNLAKQLSNTRPSTKFQINSMGICKCKEISRISSPSSQPSTELSINLHKACHFQAST